MSIGLRYWLNRSAMALVVAAGLAVSHATGASRLLTTVEDSEEQTAFTLDFPDLGITSSSRVIATRFNLEIDDETNTARFTEYFQLVESLTLPLGITTGPITVRIVSSEGAYSPSNQEFETVDLYEISFTNDLSAFGFESPVVIPSRSRGTVAGGAASARSVGMVWRGTGELANSSNPDEPFKYTYTCESKTVVTLPENVPPLPSVSAFQTPQQLCGAGSGACGPTGLVSVAGLVTGFGLMRIRPIRRRR